MESIFQKNPFQFTTPEDLTAEEMKTLFVDVYSDYPKIIDPGHLFIKGPRGVGKSMMFRYLQPDCQCLVEGKRLDELDFLGIYIPLKNTNFSLTELRRLENRHASDILNEHLLVTHILVRVFDSLSEMGDPFIELEHTRRYFYEIFLPELDDYDEPKNLTGEFEKPSDYFTVMKNIMVGAHKTATKYTRKLAFSERIMPYDGPLYEYVSFALPLLSGLTTIHGLPQKPIYLLIDDAHCLNDTQTRVLNSWVATRTSRKVSLKISTQYNYKNVYTVSGSTIDTPHDYMEIDMSTVYTSSQKLNYKERIRSIVKKRLLAVGIDTDPYDFFPVDKKQEDAIERIANEYKLRADQGEGKGYYRSDDAYRYARPDYIKSLAGTKKASSKYSYAGFEQLVHLSSGVVRHFLHPAYLMYANAKALAKDVGVIQSISPTIQNSVVRDEANDFLFSDLARLSSEGHAQAWPKASLEKLLNLVQGLGGLFRNILVSARSERRVFSIALSSMPSAEVLDVLELGVQLGYFHRSTIGRKDSRSGGRTMLYILNRRLAPVWTLDPSGFAGYLFVTNEFLLQAIHDPFKLLRKVQGDTIPNGAEYVQLSFLNGPRETEIGEEEGCQ